MLELIRPSEDEVPLSDSVIDDDLIIFTVKKEHTDEIFTFRADRKDTFSDILDSIDSEDILDPSLHFKNRQLAAKSDALGRIIGNTIHTGSQLYLRDSTSSASQELSGILIREIRDNRIFETYELDRVLTARSVLNQLAEEDKELKLASEGELVWKSVRLQNSETTLKSMGIRSGDVLFFHHKNIDVEIRIPPLASIEARKIKLKLGSYETIGSTKSDILDSLIWDDEAQAIPYDLAIDGSRLSDQTSIQEVIIGKIPSGGSYYDRTVWSLMFDVIPILDVDLCLHLQIEEGAYFSAIVKPSHTVRDLKRLVFMKKCYPVPHQLLKFGETELQDSRTLQSYGLVNGANVDIYLKSYIIKVNSRPSNEEDFAVIVSSSNTVRVIKRKIHAISAIRVEAQNLFLSDGRELKNDSILSEIGLLEETALILTFEAGVELRSPIFKTYLKTLVSKIFTVETHADCLVRIYKEKLHKAEGIPTDRIVLVFDGKQLEDENALSDYGIGPNTTLYLILKPSA